MPLWENTPSLGENSVRSEHLRAIRRVIAVVGCQRSGTTLIGQILGAHSTAFLVDEFDGLYPWFHAFAADGRDEDSSTQDLLTRAMSKYRNDDSRFRVEGGRVTLSPTVSALVLKAPNLTFDEEILAGFPIPVTVVYSIRDPRAVVASMTRLQNIDFLGNQLRLIAQRPKTVARYAAECAHMASETETPCNRRAVLWRVKSGRASDFSRAGLPVQLFHYEDLVSRPQAKIPSLLEACGLEESERAFAAHTVYRGLGPGATDRTRAIDVASLDAWRSVLSPPQQADILDAAQPLAGLLGYV
jgi:hypothetical protein